MNTRRAIKEARQLGCHVEIRRGTGEWKIQHPDWGRVLLINSRRKDCPRILTVLLKRIR